MMDRNTLLELIPAYAVDALDADERQAVAAFLERDPEAQALLADYEAITAMLPLAAPMRPAPSHLNNDLRTRLAARKTNHQPSSESAPPKAEEPPALKVVPKPEKPSRAMPIAAWLVAAAAVVAVAIVGGFLLLRTNPTQNMSPEMIAAKELYDAIAADTTAVRYEVTSAEDLSVQGELLVSADGSDAVLRIASLPQIAAEQSYQLWLATGETINSGGVFHWPTGHGPYYLKINVPVDELVRIGMTIEPYDGSEQPAGDRLFGVEIASR